MTKPMIRPRPALLSAATLTALTLGGVWALNHNTAEAEAPPPAKAAAPVAVTTARVRQTEVPVYRSGIGNVAAAQTVTVRTRVDGQLDRIGFSEGQDVRAGQLLARLDPRTLQASLAQAQAQLAKDQASLQNARADLSRYTQLMRDDAATQQQFDTQKALVAQDEATVKTDQAAVESARVQLSFTTITAPISGRVGARLVDVGNIVHSSDTTGLVVINQIDPIAVVFTLPEDAFQDVNRAINAAHGDTKKLAVQVYPRTSSELLGTGSLTLINNQIDTANGTVTLKGTIPNPTHALWPGQYVNVRLQLGQGALALTIPEAAVQRGQNGTYVYAVEADGRSVKVQPIQVTRMQDGLAIIGQGLTAGQTVVVDGQYKLKPGATITEAGHATSAARAASGSATPASQESRT